MIAPIRDGKVCQGALRHRVRNLRAKVRLLLPVDVCCKHKKRTKNVLKMMHNRDFHHQDQEWYAPSESTRQKHIFEKLTNAQIQQIKQDKMYYVGEDFIEQFDRFIEGKNTANSWKLRPSNFSIPELGVKPHMRNHKTSSSNYSQFCDEKQNYQGRKLHKQMKLESIKEKRKLITEQAMRRKVIIREKMKQRQRKRELNCEKIFAQRQRMIQERSMVNQLRTSMSFRAKKHMDELGQITQLSQKLRDMCLQNSNRNEI